jgi:hypothetical protein
MKRLIVCSDGTWNKPAQEDRDQVAPSNVFKMSEAVSEQDGAGHQQIFAYDNLRVTVRLSLFTSDRNMCPMGSYNRFWHDNAHDLFGCCCGHEQLP